MLILMLVGAGLALHVDRLGEDTDAAFASQDVDALRASTETLRGYGVIGDGAAAFAEGDALVLEGRLDDAEKKFADALGRVDGDAECPVRVNLEFVRETLGDIGVNAGRVDDANSLYKNAIAVVDEAPAGCFEGNADPDEQRRALRSDAKARLERKIAVINAPPPPPPKTAPPVADQPPPPPGAPAGAPAGPPPGLPPIAQREPGQGMVPGPSPGSLPGENLPSLPQQVPVQEPAPGPGAAPDEPQLGVGVADPNAPQPIRIMGEVGPDGIPIGDPGVVAPPLTLGPADGSQLDRLEELLENANSFSGDRE
ncbi:hypothetical protein FK535_26080 [Mycolicibacterium sp. 018/SC-01/001]|uniref:hypothetical protein n=1 Tax=Mycolicibacterium sp. 018/SC-01/001 TaxID=2592069 RepID=UPI00117E87DA|nr:hypothetical protein [Mycolicibacterium sp. 018/SC-01/001]TRW78229.1 hypothetical protein FK535_26080 [Mycolicibacterium sp. 018/SC-01/001]